MVRVAHFSPDAPAVDVYVNDDRVLSGVEYKTVSKYLELPAGSYDLAVRPAGAAASSDPVIEATAEVEAGNAYTVAAVGALADIAAEIFADDLSAPGSGKAKVRVIHAAPEVPAVDVAVKGGPTLFEGAEFPSATDYAEVDAATYPVQVKAAGSDDVLLEASLPVKAGTIYSVAAVGGAGKDVELLPIVDATGTGQAPHGGIATGAGGTAPGTAIPGVSLVLAGAAVLAVAGSAPACCCAGVPADRRVAAGLASLTLALVLGACGEPPARPEASPRPPPTTAAPTTTTAAGDPSSTRPPAGRRRRSGSRSPSIGVSSRLVRLGLNADGTMEVPRDYGLAGWFTGGAMPGQDGPAVISGHVDSKSGPAVFYRLRDLRRGDTIRVQRAAGDWLAFEVTGTARYAKAAFPTDAVFGPVTGPVLRVITCGGDFDRSSGHYLDNVVVTARPHRRALVGDPQGNRRLDPGRLAGRPGGGGQGGDGGGRDQQGDVHPGDGERDAGRLRGRRRCGTAGSW